MLSTGFHKTETTFFKWSPPDDTLPDRYSSILSDIFFDILSGINSDILYSGIISDILFGIYSRILSGI